MTADDRPTLDKATGSFSQEWLHASSSERRFAVTLIAVLRKASSGACISGNPARGSVVVDGNFDLLKVARLLAASVGG